MSASEVPRTAPRPDRVLIVDDQEETREVVHGRMKQLGFQPVAVSSAEEALAAADTADEFLAAFVDQKLGADDRAGIRLVKDILAKRKDLLVIVYTAADPKGVKDALDAGAFWYIDKVKLSDWELGAVLANVVRMWELAEKKRLAEASLHSQEREFGYLKRMMDALPLMFMIRDPEGRILWQNQEKDRLFGPLPTDGEEYCFIKYEGYHQKCPFVQSQEPRRQPCPCEEAFRTGEPQVCEEYRFLGGGDLKDGYHFVIATPIEFADGKATLVGEVVWDVTKVVETRNLITQLSRELKESDEAIVTEIAEFLYDKLHYSGVRGYLVEGDGESIAFVRKVVKGWQCRADSDRFLREKNPGTAPIWEEQRDMRAQVVVPRELIEKGMDRAAFAPFEDVAEILWIPFFCGGELAGLLACDYRDEEDQSIPKEDLYYGEVLARHLSQFFDNRRYLTQLRESKEDLEWLNRMAHVLAEAKTPEEMFQNVVSEVQQRFQAGTGQAHCLSPDRQRLILTASVGHEPGCRMLAAGTSVAVGVNARACQTGELQFVEDTSADPDYCAFWEKYADYRESCTTCREGARSLVAAPFTFGGKTVGSLCLMFREPRAFSQRDRALLGGLCNTISVSLATAERVALAEASAIEARKLADISHMATGMAHEFLTPIQTILTAVEVLRESAVEDDWAASLENVRTSAQRVQEVLDALLYFAKPETRSGAPVELNRLVDQVLTFQRERLRAHEIELKLVLDGDIPISTQNEEALKMIVGNLVQNGIQSMLAKGGEGSLGVTTLWDSERQEMKLSVSDTGVGIPGHLREKLSMPFFTTRGPEHPGLGLFLVRSIVEAMGGTVDLESSLGNGAEFTVSLPWRKAE